MSEEWIRERKERERTNLNRHIDIHIFIIPLSLPLSLFPLVTMMVLRSPISLLVFKV